MSKPFDSKEKFVCELTWGCIPVDCDWARSTSIFKDKLREFYTTKKYDGLYYHEKKQRTTTKKEQ